MKKRIVHLIQSLDSGGCENMLLRTLPLLNEFDHLIITLKNKGELAHKIEKTGIKIISIKQKSLLDIPSYFRLSRKISRYRPNLIITYLFHADIIGRLFIQIISKAQVVPFLRTTYNYKKYWFPRLFEKLTKHFLKKYLANSESVKNFYIKEIGVPKEKITVVPNGINVSYFDKLSRNENFRRKLGIKNQETAIICVANFHINKGHKYLLEAFENVYKENKHIKLLLVGDGDEKENLENQIKNYKSKNNAIFLGKRNDVPRLLKISDIFILPTLFEGMSNAIMEAMASGLPIITTNIPENKELIKNNKTGLLIPVKDNVQISEALNLLIKDFIFREKLSESANKKINNSFLLKKIIKKWNTFIIKTIS